MSLRAWLALAASVFIGLLIGLQTSARADDGRGYPRGGGGVPSSFGALFGSIGGVDAGTIILPTNGRICFDGPSCTKRLVWDGTTINLVGALNAQAIYTPNGILGDYAGGNTTPVFLRGTSSNNAAAAALDVGNSISLSAAGATLTRWYSDGFSTLKASVDVNGLYNQVAQAVTGTDDGAGTNRAITLSVTSAYITLDCQDTNGCDVTMSETNIAAGTHTCVHMTGTGTTNFSDSSGVSELAGAFAAGQRDSICMTYVADRWVENSRSNN